MSIVREARQRRCVVFKRIPSGCRGPSEGRAQIKGREEAPQDVACVITYLSRTSRGETKKTHSDGANVPWHNSSVVL